VVSRNVRSVTSLAAVSVLTSSDVTAGHSVAVTSVTLDVLIPLHVAVVRLALVVVVALCAGRKLSSTHSIHVIHRLLLTDELRTTLCVSLTHLTIVDASHTYTGLQTHAPEDIHEVTITDVSN